MVSITKETMVQYLKDYAYIQIFVMKNLKKEFMKNLLNI